jgi:hypothetical protein
MGLLSAGGRTSAGNKERNNENPAAILEVDSVLQAVPGVTVDCRGWTALSCITWRKLKDGNEKDGNDEDDEEDDDDDDDDKNDDDKASEDAEARAGKQYLYAHGSLMIIGWGLLLPSGVIFAALAKHRPGGLWFKGHRFLQMSGLIVVLTAWMIARNRFDDVEVNNDDNSDMHMRLGLIVMIIGLAQPLNAVLRPHAPGEGAETTTIRWLWEITHKTLGYTAVLVAACTIILGTTLIPTAEARKTFQFAYGIGVVLLLVSFIVALLMDRKMFQEPADQDGHETTLSAPELPEESRSIPAPELSEESQSIPAPELPEESQSMRTSLRSSSAHT